MNVDLTPDQRASSNGRSKAAGSAMRKRRPAVWEERERRRLEILMALDEAEASLARGEGRRIAEESMKALAADSKDENDLDGIWYFLATRAAALTSPTA